LVGSTLPALERNAGDVVAFFLIEHFKKGLLKSCPHLGGRPAEVDKSVASVIEHGHRPPALGFSLGLVEHGRTLLGRELGSAAGEGDERAGVCQDQLTRARILRWPCL
jgi:hypothetical protein